MIALGLFSFDPSPFHSGSYTVEILAKAYMYKLSYPSTNPYTHMRTKYAEYPSVLWWQFGTLKIYLQRTLWLLSACGFNIAIATTDNFMYLKSTMILSIMETANNRLLPVSFYHE